MNVQLYFLFDLILMKLESIVHRMSKFVFHKIEKKVIFSYISSFTGNSNALDLFLAC